MMIQCTCRIGSKHIEGMNQLLDTPIIVKCPLCKAAPALLEAVKESRRIFEIANTSTGFSFRKLAMDMVDDLEQLEEAIQQAEKGDGE